MPSGQRINWSEYDQLIILHLPNNTISDWCRQYASHISPKAIGARAKQLGIIPAKYTPSELHKYAISNSLIKETPEMVEIVKNHIDILSRKELAKKVGISAARLNDLIKRHEITLSENGLKRAREASTRANIGKTPWNKGKKLSEEHKLNMAKGRQKMSGRLSKLQMAFYRILDENGINYFPESDEKCRFGHWLFDCRITHGGCDILVEVQGDYIHSLPKNKSKDRAKATYMERYFPNIPIKYIWEHEFGAQNRVKQVVNSWLGINTIEQIDFNLKDVTIKQIDTDQAYEFLAAFHYLGKLPGRFKFGAYLEEKLIAVVVFSAPTRVETAIRLGCTTHTCLELRRLVMHDQYHKKNFGSFLLSKVEKLLPKSVTTLVSFADPGVGHDGTIYKASNWNFDGESSPSYYYIDDDGYVMLKKTLFNLANKMHMKEADFADTYNYSKVPTLKKLRFVKKIN